MHQEDIKSIKEVISNYTPISLEEMSSVSLMKRIDTKYVVPIHKMDTLLKMLSDDYFVFEIENIRYPRYETLYYDTPELDLYKIHHQGKLNRYKIRERRYTESDMSFFEIKFKTNKNDTIKSRISIPTLDGKISGDKHDFLHEISGLNGDNFEPQLWVYYKRITLVSKALNERATIDLELTFEQDEKVIANNEIAIIEAKRDKRTKSTPMLKALKELNIRPGGFSKYCIGLACINPDLKSNNFKDKQRKIQKTKNEYVPK